MDASGGQEVQWNFALFASVPEADYARREDLGGLGDTFLVSEVLRG